MAGSNTTAGIRRLSRPSPVPWEGPLVSETLDLFSAESGDSADPARSGGQHVGVAEPAGTSHASAGAVRSEPDAVGTAGRNGAPGRAAGLSGMLLPELQRVAQSMGITGTARMRKGQLIAAIEEKRSGRQPGGEAGAAAARDQEPRARIETSDKSVQRGAPAGAGADRTFEQDAM